MGMRLNSVEKFKEIWVDHIAPASLEAACSECSQLVSVTLDNPFQPIGRGNHG